MTALTKAVAWIVISMAFLGGSAQADDKTAIGHQIAEAMIEIARHGNLHDVAYTHERLPLPFALTRELNFQSKASDTAIQYYDLTLTPRTTRHDVDDILGPPPEERLIPSRPTRSQAISTSPT